MHTWVTLRVKVMEFMSVGTRLDMPFSRIPESSAAPESLARSAEMACRNQCTDKDTSS